MKSRFPGTPPVTTTIMAMLLALPAIAALAHVPRSPEPEAARLARELRGGSEVPLERDRYGRIRAPVMLNGRGPFQLIVDTGANRSAVTGSVALALGMTPGDAGTAILHGVTGSSRVASIQVDSMKVGRLELAPGRLPVVLDAADQADGFLGPSDLTDRRLLIDFENRRMSVLEPGKPAAGTVRIPAEASDERMLVVAVRIRGVRVHAVLDTGAEATIGNLALLHALGDVDLSRSPVDRIIGTTAEPQAGHTADLPEIEVGPLRIRGARASYGDVPAFRTLRIGDVPSLLLGMDVIGQFASLAIDYARGEVQLRPRTAVAR